MRLVLAFAAAAALAAPAAFAQEGVHRFKAGGLDAWALQDGQGAFPNDGKIFGADRTPADVAAVLTAAGLPGDQIGLSIQAFLIRTGDRLVLLDGGAGASMGPMGGRLPERLRAAGFAPEQVTDVVVSHAHPDHVAGLVGADGKLTFPNARVHVASAEWAAMQANPALAELAPAIASKVVAAEPGAEIAPGVRTVAISGHTAGHQGVEVGTGKDAVRYVGDSVHHHVLSTARPEWQVAFDGGPGWGGDRATATASRKALLEEAATSGRKLASPHFPFPGLGHVRRDGAAYRWEPAS